VTQTLDPDEQVHYESASAEPEILDESDLDPASPVDNRDQRIAELEEHVKGVSAEFENFRRRLQDDQKRRQVLMKEELFRSFLPIVDNLDRTLEAGRTSATLEALLKGVELTRRNVSKLFEDNDVEAVETQGATFDPSIHEAMMTEDRNDVPDQTIVAELQKGYKIGDRLLRASLVKVARNSN
jgi:molecular chaperone GrpE